MKNVLVGLMFSVAVMVAVCGPLAFHASAQCVDCGVAPVALASDCVDCGPSFSYVEPSFSYVASSAYVSGVANCGSAASRRRFRPVVKAVTAFRSERQSVKQQRKQQRRALFSRRGC